MEVEVETSDKPKDVDYKENGIEETTMEEGEEEERISRPSTPSMPIFDILPKNEDEWWRPSHPPETYLWEQVRRDRQKGGYPWTLLDKDDEIDAEEYLDDNLYEPVNPPPLYGTGSTYMAKDQHETGSLDGRMIDIPPEIEIVNSEGLDGLDQPDPHEYGFDGDKEWMHSDDEHATPSKALFTAGIRRKERSKDPDTPRSSIRPLTNKAITFATETTSAPESERIDDESHEVLQGPQQQVAPSSSSSAPKKTTTAFEILKSKAAGAAGQVKQRINKIALPVRPKFNQWDGVKLARKKSKKKSVPGTADQEVPDEEAVEDAENVQEPADESMLFTEDQTGDISISPKETKAETLKKEKEAAAENLKKEKEAAAENLKKEKEAAAEVLKKEKEAAAEVLKKEKEAAAEVLKKEKEAAAEEKQRKAKEQEELKRQKAEEKQKAKDELQKKKAEEKSAKLKAAEDAKKVAEDAKKVKLEEQLSKAREAEEQRKLQEEELQKSHHEEDAQMAEGTEASEIVDEEEKEQEVPTPTGTGSRRKKIKKTFVQLPHLPKMPDLPQLPHIDLDFRKKVIKRSKTPPSRPQPPRLKSSRRGVEETENQLAAQYANELQARKLEMEDEDELHVEPGKSGGLREPQIYVTQPSTEPLEDATHVDWMPPQSTSTRSDEADAGVDEEAQSSKKAAPAAKERLDKIGKSLKGFGVKSKEMASQKSKAMGQTMKVIGKDLQKFGVKTSEKFQATIEEIKAKQEAAKARTKQKAKEAEDIEDDLPMEVEVNYESATEPRRKFRFRRRGESQDEQEEGEPKEYYNDSEEIREPVKEDTTVQDEGRITRSQLLGRADRDWESPLDLSQSREVSEEPFHSGNVSSRDSPPGSSLASSTFAHVRKQGVLEEIDSDEFFLREKGISEGEDEEEINRFLVEELRQAFRPQQSNALAGFDLPTPPQRPGRLPRKPPRKDRGGDKSPSYQTFPPERPRRTAPGYVSAYMHEHQEQDMEDDGRSNEEERGSIQEDIDEFEDEEGIRTMKEELNRIDQEINNEEQGLQKREYDDDGRYEPVSEEPVKPQRTKKSQKPSTPLYYNTVAGNEWMREIEEQVVANQSPIVPRRERNKSSKSGSLPPESGENEINFVEEDLQNEDRFLPPSTPSAPLPYGGQVDDTEMDLDGDLEYVDEAGYAVVHKGKEPPTTVPRKKKRAGSKGNSLKRRSQEQEQLGGSEPAFFSLPRNSARTFHIVPPSRPQRTYSTLKPRRPPRNKSNNGKGKGSSKGKGDKDDSARPSTAIGIMQGRPLPAPPRPERSDRSPVPLNDLDHTSIERAVGARHYANFDGDDVSSRDIVEEVFTATNIPLLGRPRDEQLTTSAIAAGDINIGIQTDPLLEDDLKISATVLRSYEVEDSGRVDKPSDSLRTAASYDQAKRPERPKTPPVQNQGEPPIPQNRTSTSEQQQQFVFPRRLHLDELEVDVLRVNDLSAHSITVEHLSAPQLEVNSLTSVGPLSVSSIHTQTLNSDQINCNRLSSDTVDLPSIPPASFFKLSSPVVPVQILQPSQPPPTQIPVPEETTEELRLETAEKEETENDSACPYTQDEYFETKSVNRASPEADYQKECSSPTEEFIRSSSITDYCMTPDQPIDSEDKWDQSIPSDELSKASETPFDPSDAYNQNLKYSEEPEPTEPFDDFAQYSENQQESFLTSDEFPRSTDELSESFSPYVDHRKGTDEMDTQSYPTNILLEQQTDSEERQLSPSDDDILKINEEFSEYQKQNIINSEDLEELAEATAETPLEDQLSSLVYEHPDDILEAEEEEVGDVFDADVDDILDEVLQAEEEVEEEGEEEEVLVRAKGEITSEVQNDVSPPPYESEDILEADEDEYLFTPEKSLGFSETNADSIEIVEEFDGQVLHAILQASNDQIKYAENLETQNASVQNKNVSKVASNEEQPDQTLLEELSDLGRTIVEELSEPVQNIIVPEQASNTNASRELLSQSTSPLTPESQQSSEREEDVIELSIRLCRALTRLAVRGLQAIIDYIDTATSDDPSKAEQQKAHMQVLLCVLLILIAGILLSSRSGPSPPRWEFLMPPPDL